MPRCGCGDQCTCLVQEGVGIDVTGNGNPNNPFNVAFDGGEVAGPGIGWVDNTLVARIAPGGGLEFDGTGAMRTTGGGGGGGGNPASVAALVAKGSDVVGGALGAGYMLKPPDLLSTFTYGAQIGLDLMQVPVRFLSDGTPVVRTAETLLRTTPARDAEPVQEQDPSRWRSLADRPGKRLYPDEITGTISRYEPTEGHYGYTENGQRDGLTSLADVFLAVGGKVVLLLDLRFPARNIAGDYVSPTPHWRVDLFLNRVRDLISRFGLSGSVIITSSDVDVRVTQGVIDVIDYFASLGLTAGPTITTPAEAAATPPDGTWPDSWRWVFLSSTLPRATLEPYVAKSAGGAPLNVMLFNVQRQYLRRTLVNSAAQTAGATGIGARGVISAEPEYYRGEVVSWRYRQVFATLGDGTIKNGILPSVGDEIAEMPAMRRGYQRAGYNSIFLDAAATPPNGSASAWSLMGWSCPVSTPNSWAMDVGLGFDQINGYGEMKIAFGVLTDHGFRDPVQPPTSQANHPLDSGYVLSFDNAGYVWLFAFDQGLRTSMVAAQRPSGAAPLVIGSPGHADTARGKPYYYRIGVNENGLRISTIPNISGVGTVLYDVKTTLAKTYRGAYVFFGRSGLGSWTGFIDSPLFLASGAAPAGPTP
jgi:hypothetical protein